MSAKGTCKFFHGYYYHGGPPQAVPTALGGERLTGTEKQSVGASLTILDANNLMGIVTGMTTAPTTHGGTSEK